MAGNLTNKFINQLINEIENEKKSNVKKTGKQNSTVNSSPKQNSTVKEKPNPKSKQDSKSQINKKQQIEKPPKDFSLIKKIRSEKDYKSNIQRRDKNSRKYIDENFSIKGQPSILPGQLIMFNYFEPATKDQLQYYDAMPCTIFFGIVKTKNGPRVIGFNIHYYPPRIRFQLLDRIFDIFKPIYLKNWNNSLDEEMSYFNYKMLIYQLQKAKLDFGIREYIPNLMGNIVPVPPKGWSKAVFTEGRFKKETRTQILNYWKNKSDSISKPKKSTL